MTAALDLDDAATLLRVLGHGIRLRLLASLVATERAVSDIETLTRTTQPMLSQQLGVLRKAGLVKTRREAKQIFYQLDHARLASLGALLDGMASIDAGTPEKAASAPTQQGISAAMFARVD